MSAPLANCTEKAKSYVPEITGQMVKTGYNLQNIDISARRAHLPLPDDEVQ
ncbi:hypothetical protein SCD92_08345 [Gilvimarinus sp. SDUM040013]|uniref:Uncharacterized protein n=1 Tax=Gilvimarinus gilvus TaxID=3058038 RepID=A0ABU4RWY0_9GAMM|nr:hypothetical protein [Gilvimarinus sp. SDUM040013]MDX6849367.1 hypothetical protein [Gilvimarinus sp. SDUM040013]